MYRIKFSYIFIASLVSFLLLTFIYHQKTHQMAIDNAKVKINELLLNYQAVRDYVSKVQKQEVYTLQEEGGIDKEYFNPILLSSTFSAKNVNYFYNLHRKKQEKHPITIRFASDNPRNIANKATPKESELLKKFNNKEIVEFTQIIKENGEPILYYVLPTKPTEQKCMRCHSDPSLAPRGLIKMYGEESGFYEKAGDIRAVLSTSYPLKDDFEVAKNTFFLLSLVTFGIFSMLLLLVYFFIKKINQANVSLDRKVIQRTKELKKEKEYIKTILDINPNIILVINRDEIRSANRQFYQFFECETIEQFVNQNISINKYVKEIDKKKLSVDSKIEGKIWYEYLASVQKKIHYLTVEFNDKVSCFIASATHFNKYGDVLLTLNDITEQVKKDKLLHEQSKLAAMGEMIGNIAHQWRQPLSVISTSASGMQVQKQYGMLEDDKFDDYCNIINENVQYLSKTIDDFRDFLKTDKQKTKFYLRDSIGSFLKLVDGSIKNDNLNIVLDIDEEVSLFGYPNELVQCFMNFFNNSKDALSAIQEEDRYIFISVKKVNNETVIKFKDSGGGIDASILPKIFEPYFTTKHQSQGTGLGLHMVYNMIVDGMGGVIDVKNTQYQYENKKLKGVEFKIIFLD